MTWWQIYPLGFLGAERTAEPPGGATQHRLPALTRWLDYAADLGVEGVVLNPVFSSLSHGYDTTDHFQVDPRLGDEADLVGFVGAAHAKGLLVVLDGVFNHVGRAFGPLVDVQTNGPSSPYASWFRATWPDGRSGEPDGRSGEPDGPAGEPQFDVFEGHQALVALNHDSPEVVEYVRSVMDYWCERGIDGWRLDAAYAVPPAFWAQVLPALREKYRSTWIFGELIHGDYAGFVQGAGFDSATQYELWKAIGSSIDDANFFELAWALKRHSAMVETFAPVTFLGNHDTTRIASRLADPRHLPHALAILFGIGGTPIVYAGDEQAFTGVKYDREGGDDEVRPRFPASPDELSRLGEGIHALHRRLIALRNARPWLARAATTAPVLTNTTVLLVSASGDPSGDPEKAFNGVDDDKLAVALSVQDAPSRLALPGDGWRVAEGAATLEGGSVLLPGHGWAVLTG